MCSQIAEFGFTAVRFSADWALLTGFFGGVNYKPLIAVQKALESHGLTPLPIIGCHAPWAPTPAKFGDFAKGVVDVFGDIPAYEVWNEPNLWNFSLGSPTAFLPYLRAGTKAVRSVGSKSIHGGLAAYIDWRLLWMRNYAPSTWLEGLHSAGESNDYDILGYHPYALNAGGSWADPATNPFGLSELSKMDAVRAKYNDTRPYAFTEVGFNSSRANDWLPGQVETLRSHPNLDSMWFFCWRDTSGDGGNYGVLNRSNVPKQPYYSTVQGLLRT